MSIVDRSARKPHCDLFLYRVMILDSLMSCGTAPSCQHWQRTLCSGSSKVVLQCLINSGGILSLPGALPEAKLSMALPSSSTDGSESNSSMVSRHSMISRAAGDTVFSLSRGQNSVPPISPSACLCL